jgi:hypothetical protein
MENQPLLSGELPRLKKRGFAILVFIAVLTTIAVIISGLNTRQVTVNQVSGVRWFCAWRTAVGLSHSRRASSCWWRLPHVTCAFLPARYR